MPHDAIETRIGSLEIIDHQGVDWTTVRKTAYLIHQRLRYEYPGEIHDLRQRLMIVPPERHGGQRLVTAKVEVSAPAYEIERERDNFGNLILNLSVAHVEREIEFTAWIIVERDATADAITAPAETAQVATLLAPTALTMPDDALRTVATALMTDGSDPATRAARINDWVHGALSYAHGITGVRTAASEALAAGRGVCQDYAHIMLTLCRLCGLPARYVSGHLLGEGGTHAWVEVIVADAAGARAAGFDPCNGRRAGRDYLTVATGRDYTDVAPTSGTYLGTARGTLTATKRVGVTLA